MTDPEDGRSIRDSPDAGMRGEACMLPRPPSRAEWLEFLSDEVGTRDRRVYWLAILLALLSSGCYYLASQLYGGSLIFTDSQILASLSFGLLLGLWTIDRLFPRMRQLLRPSKTYSWKVDARIVPLLDYISKHGLPSAVASRFLVFSIGLGVGGWLVWLLRGFAGSVGGLTFTIWSVFLFFSSGVYLLVSVTVLLGSSGVAVWPNKLVVWLLIYVLETRLPSGVFTIESWERLREIVDTVEGLDAPKTAMGMLDESGFTALLGIPSLGGTPSTLVRVMKVTRKLFTLLFVGTFLWFLAQMMLPLNQTGIALQLLSLAFLVPITIRLILELVQNPARRLVEQLRLAILDGRLDENEAVYAYQVILSIEDTGWGSAPELMTLLLQFNVISLQRYLESLTYPRPPRISAEAIQSEVRSPSESGEPLDET